MKFPYKCVRLRLKPCSCLALLVLLVCVLPIRSQQVNEKVVLKGSHRAVPGTFFGLNIIAQNQWAKWPFVPFGTWRSFHFNWSDVEPTAGQWQFSQADFEVEASAEHDIELLPVLEGVPAWADSPRDLALLQSSSRLQRRQRSMPIDKKLYADYVRAVATRYKGRIHAYELWNEPIGVTNFAHDIAAVVELNEIAYRTLKQVDPTITVVSSAYSSGSPDREKSIQQFEEFTKAGGFKDCDVVAFHYYLIPSRGNINPVPPEQILEVNARVNNILAANGIHKPIWATELGWPTLNDDRNPVAPPKGTGKALPPARAAAWLARSYVLGWAAGIQRMYWYAWRHDYFGLTEEDGSPKATSVAYATIHSWLEGHRVESCVKAVENSVWTCNLIDPSGRLEKILWAESGLQRLQIPKGWHVTRISRLDGSQVPNTSSLQLDESPVLIDGRW
jgi:hypothetical protein